MTRYETFTAEQERPALRQRDLAAPPIRAIMGGTDDQHRCVRRVMIAGDGPAGMDGRPGTPGITSGAQPYPAKEN